MIHMVDSGGQPAFFDFHPMVSTSRALYLIVYNSELGLFCPSKDNVSKVLSVPHEKFTQSKPDQLGHDQAFPTHPSPLQEEVPEDGE